MHVVGLRLRASTRSTSTLSTLPRPRRWPPGGKQRRYAPHLEFRDLSLLEPILGRHPLWPRFRSILDSGSDWALDPVSDESRLDSVTKNIGRGNHKSARDRPEVLKDEVLDDVTRGFALPLPAKVAPLIPGAEVAPMGLVAQNTISEAGEIMPKDRLTHDQSF